MILKRSKQVAGGRAKANTPGTLLWNIRPRKGHSGPLRSLQDRMTFASAHLAASEESSTLRQSSARQVADDGMTDNDKESRTVCPTGYGIRECEEERRIPFEGRI